MIRFIALSRIRHNGKVHEPGDTIKLDDENQRHSIDRLWSSGHIRCMNDKEHTFWEAIDKLERKRNGAGVSTGGVSGDDVGVVGNASGSGSGEPGGAGSAEPPARSPEGFKPEATAADHPPATGSAEGSSTPSVTAPSTKDLVVSKATPPPSQKKVA